MLITKLNCQALTLWCIQQMCRDELLAIWLNAPESHAFFDLKQPYFKAFKKRFVMLCRVH